MKRFWGFLWVLLAFTGLLAAVGYYLMASSRPLEAYLTQTINRQNPFIQVSGLSIERHFFTSQRSFVIQGIMADLRLNGQDAHVKLDEVTVFNPSSLFFKNEETRLDFLGGSFEMDGIQWREARSRLRYRQQDKAWRLTGRTFIFGLILAERHLKNVSFDIEADEGGIAVSKFDSRLSQGSIKGDLNLAFDGTFPYNLSLTIEQVPAHLFALDAFKIEKRMKGVINGHLKMQGDNNKIVGLDAKFQAPQGMYVNAKVLSPLLNYIPQSMQRKNIEQIIEQGDNIFLDSFTLDVVNDKSDKLKTAFDLKSIEYNLDVNLGVDINVEGGLMALLKQGLNYIPKKTAP